MSIKENEVFELQTPSHVVSLATSGMLVSTDIRVWSATKQNKEVADEVCKDKKASEKAGKFVQHLLAGNIRHRDIKRYRATIDNWHRRKAFQWNKGQSYVFTSDLQEYMQEWREHKAEFERLVENFCLSYPHTVSKMAFEDSGQGDMFDRNHYPSVEEVKSRFRCDIFVSEVPECDPRCEIAQDLMHDLKDNFARQCSDKIDAMVQQQTDMLVEVMQSLVKTCGGTEEYKVKGVTKTRNSPISASTLSKAIDYCKRFKKYTLVDSDANSKLQSAIKLLDDTLNGVDIKTLRESDIVRDNVKSNIENILDKLDF
tara:strand:+ start:234 stop:1172 length:939 start_codon:yes stop_codon:yes gene_type:complete